MLSVGQDHLAAVYIDTTPPGPVTYKSEKGLVEGNSSFPSHQSPPNAYCVSYMVDEPFYVTKAVEVAGRRFLLMRNPWGHKSKEWTGRWGTGSPEWTPEWLKRVIAGEFAPFQFGQEGMFIMECESPSHTS